MWRARSHISDGFQSSATQSTGDRLIRAQRPDRQSVDSFGFIAFRNDTSLCDAAECTSANRRGCNRGIDLKALTLKRGTHRPHHRSFAAEQMRAAADIEKQSVRRIQRDQWREAVAPVGDIAEKFCVRRLVRIKHLQIGTDHARISQRLTNIETH